MANQAQYTIPIPKDPRDLARAANHWVTYGDGPNMHDSFIHRSIEGPEGLRDHLVMIGQDTPEIDSRVKQLAHHIGEMANHPYINVHKQNGDGVNSWMVNNRSYQNDQMANAQINPSM